MSRNGTNVTVAEVSFDRVSLTGELTGYMDEKTLTAISTSLAFMQIQVNALLLLLERQHPGAPIRRDFQRLISEGVEALGIETMEGIKTRIREGIISREMMDFGIGDQV